MDSAWWTSKTAGKQLIMSPNMVTRIKPNWEQGKICFQVSFVIRHGTCRDCEMLQCGITDHWEAQLFQGTCPGPCCEKLIYISSCIFRCLHQESEKWTTWSSRGVFPVLFEQHKRRISNGTCAVRAVASESERQPLMVPVIRCRLCRATRVNATADTSGETCR